RLAAKSSPAKERPGRGGAFSADLFDPHSFDLSQIKSKVRHRKNAGHRSEFTPPWEQHGADRPRRYHEIDDDPPFSDRFERMAEEAQRSIQSTAGILANQLKLGNFDRLRSGQFHDLFPERKFHDSLYNLFRILDEAARLYPAPGQRKDSPE